MTHPTSDGISSGAHYSVTRTDGQLPDSAADFVGSAAFLIQEADHKVQIEGVGRLDTCGTGVHFYQKDRAHDGRDVRIWHIRSLPDSRIIAEHVAAI